MLIQDQHLLEKLARFNRERIPERVVHANGSAAYGTFEVTADVTRWTRARFLGEVGKRTETFLRFSTVAGGRGSADAVRDPRGFALKFYTEDGNYDLVGNNTPIFFIHDPLKFPDFIHSQKPDPFTNHQEPDNVWDFFSHSPEATHMFTWLFGDRGIPASYRHMDGFSSHTYQWVNAEGEAVWVKYHFKTDQGIRCLDSAEAAELAGLNPDSHQLDLIEAIERGEFPSWTLKVQIMPVDEADGLPGQPVRPDQGVVAEGLPADRGRQAHPRPQRRQLLRRCRAGGLRPGQLRPRHRPVARQDAPGSAVRLRRRPPLPARDQPHPAAGQRASRHRGPQLRARRSDGRRTETVAGPRTTSPTASTGRSRPVSPTPLPFELHGSTGTYEWDRRETDDFTQAGDLYRLQPADAQARLVANIAGGLAAVSPGPIGDGYHRAQHRPLPGRRPRVR